MANVVKKHSISFELAQKMVDKAVAKAEENWRQRERSDSRRWRQSQGIQPDGWGPDPYH